MATHGPTLSMDLPCQWVIDGQYGKSAFICQCHLYLTDSATMPSHIPTTDMHRYIYTPCSACEFTQACPIMSYPHLVIQLVVLYIPQWEMVYIGFSMSMHTHSTQLEISFTYPKVISNVDISSLVDKVSYCIMRTFLNCQVQGSVLFKRHYHKYTAGCKPIARTVAY